MNVLPLFFNKKSLISLFVFLITVLHSAYSQSDSISKDTKISQEQQQFISTSAETVKIEHLIMDAFEKEKDTILGLQYAELYLKRGILQKDPAIRFFSNYQIAYISYESSAYEKALKHSYAATKDAEETNSDYDVISSNTLLGSVWYVLGVYDSALEVYIEMREFAAKIDHKPYEVLCLTNIANIRIKLDRHADALESFDEILYFLDTEDKSDFAQYDKTYLSALLGKGLTLIEMNEFSEAQKVYDKGIALAEKNNLPQYRGNFYVNLGKLYLKKGEYHNSLGVLREGKSILKGDASLRNNIEIADFYIANVFFEQQRYDEALALLEENFEQIANNLNADKLEEMYQLAIDISKIQQNLEKEVQFQEQLLYIVEAKNKRKSSARELLFEKDLEASELEKERLAAEKTENVNSKRVILVVSLLLFIILLLAFLRYRQQTKVKEQRFLAIIDNISKQEHKRVTEKETAHATIEDAKAKAILEKLYELEETNFFLSQECTLYSTAKLIDTNTTYLSKALNEVKNQTFNQYINKLRIEYVLVKLKEDPVFRSYTIHAISKEIGYKSATTFIKEFKQKTGLNPSYYIKKIDA